MKQNKIEFFAYSLESDKDSNTLTGYAVVFNSNSRLMEDYAGEYYTVIDPSALQRREGRDVKLLLEHDNKQILARENNGSLIVSTDEKGMRFEANLGNSLLQRDVVELVSQGIYSAMSFGVLVQDEKWETYEDKPAVRTITKGELLEFSIVSEPAFESTNLLVASDEDFSRKQYLEKLEEQKKEEEIKNHNLLLQQQAKLLKLKTTL